MSDAWEREALRWEAYNAAAWGRLRLDLIHHRLRPLLAGPGRRVLDVGCGTGETALLCAQDGAAVTAVDRSPAMVDRVRRQAKKMGLPVRVVLADAGQLGGIELGLFDLVLCHNVLGYVTDGAAILRELAARLAFEGHLSVVVNNAAAEPVRYALFGHNLAEALRWVRERPMTRAGETFAGTLRVHDRDEVVGWVQAGGLQVQGVTGLNTLAPYLPDGLKDERYADVLELEVELGQRPIYAAVAVHLHLVAVNRSRPA
jgi:S-adenosylmethionine-dependent methyltransferase